MNNILAMTALEKLSLGGTTMLLGILMVFAVLGILIGLVTLIKVIITKATSSKKKETKVAAIPAPAPVEAIAPSNDEEVVAAISAAISMYYEVESATTGKSVKFRVRSIKEIR